MIHYLDTLYAVAYSLTRNADDARTLTFETVAQAWHIGPGVLLEPQPKARLLRLLRERFLKTHPDRRARRQPA
jgi:hypothetical protein